MTTRAFIMAIGTISFCVLGILVADLFPQPYTVAIYGLVGWSVGYTQWTRFHWIDTGIWRWQR